MQEAHAVAVHAQIAPVGVEDVLCLLGHFQRVQHLVHRVAAGLDKVGEGLFHVGRVGVAVHRVGIGLGVAHFVAQLKKLGDGLAGLRAVFHHFVDERLLAEGHDAVVFFVGGDEVIGFGNAHPVDLFLHAQVPEQLAHIAGFFRGAKIVQFVQARLKLKAPPLEAGGKPAGQVVLFHKQAGIPRLQNADGGDQTAVARAYNDHVIGFVAFRCHSVPPLFYTSRFRERSSQCCSSCSLFVCL